MPEKPFDQQSATACNDRAIDLAQQGRFDEAVRGFEEAIRLQPGYAEAHNNLGNMFLFQRQLDRAAACYRQALRWKPDFAEAYHNLGNVLREQGKLEEAIAQYRQALSLRPNYANAFNSLGNALKDQGAIQEAIACYQRAIQLQPTFAEAHNNLAAALLEQDKVDEAFASCQQALRLKPQLAEAYVSLGAVLAEQRRLPEAEASYRHAIRLKPGLVEAHTNLGIALTRQGEYDKALAILNHALQLNPLHVDAHNALGTLYRDQGNMEKALACYQEAIRLKPNHAEAHWNEGLTWLLLGDTQRGWSGFRWVWQCRGFSRGKRDFRQPEWDGAPLAGQTILLHSDQGLGDALQFIRYAALVKERGGRVLVECPQSLHCLLNGCAGIDELIAAGAPLPPFDVHAPLLCVPAIMGTTLETIPARVPYLLADSRLTDWWTSELDKETRRQGDKETGRQGDRETRRQGDRGTELKMEDGGSRIEDGKNVEFHPPSSILHLRGSLSPCLPVSLSAFRVAIAWQGNPRYRLDLQRSIPLRQFAPLTRLPGVSLFSVQKGPGREQVVECRDLGIIDLESELETLQHTAAALVNMDLVITCDSAIGHLAGALGVPVWVALPFIPDWRWMLQREDSPWYPTMRLFRQQKPGDWGDVFERIVQALQSAARS